MNAKKAKGTLFETQVVRFLRAASVPAAKPRQSGRHDVGDIHVDDDIVLQAKAWQNTATALVAGVAGAQVQAGHARRMFGIAVIKKPRGSIGDAYVVMPLRVFVQFLYRTPRENILPEG